MTDHEMDVEDTRRSAVAGPWVPCEGGETTMVGCTIPPGASHVRFEFLSAPAAHTDGESKPVQCGECHLQTGETCDICGAEPASAPQPAPHLRDMAQAMAEAFDEQTLLLTRLLYIVSTHAKPTVEEAEAILLKSQSALARYRKATA